MIKNILGMAFILIISTLSFAQIDVSHLTPAQQARATKALTT